MASTSGNRYWIGFDLGGTKMMAAVLDKRFKILGSARKKTKAAHGAKEAVGRMIDTIDEALSNSGVQARQIRGIGFGSPGPLDLVRGVILESPNLGWPPVPVRQRLQVHYHCPVVVANDVDAGTYGECCFGAAQNARCAVGIFPGTGIGGACVYEGRLITGRVYSAMEVGHIIVEPGGRLCGCGRRGCLEAVASRHAIAADAALAAARGHAPHLLNAVGTDIEAIRSGAIAASIKAGDTVVEDIVRHAAQLLGIGIADLINLFAPDVVVLGGGLVEAMPDLIVSEARKSARSWAMEPLGEQTRFVAARLGDNATAMGAAALVAGVKPSWQ